MSDTDTSAGSNPVFHILDTNDFLDLQARADTLPDLDLEQSIIMCCGGLATWTREAKDFANTALRILFKTAEPSTIAKLRTLKDEQRRGWVHDSILPLRSSLGQFITDDGEIDCGSLRSLVSESLGNYDPNSRPQIPNLSMSTGAAIGEFDGTGNEDVAVPSSASFKAFRRLIDIHHDARTVHQCLSRMTEIPREYASLDESDIATFEKHKMNMEDTVTMNLHRMKHRLWLLKEQCYDDGEDHWDGSYDINELYYNAVSGTDRAEIGDDLLGPNAHDRLVQSGHAEPLLKLQKGWMELMTSSTDQTRTESLDTMLKSTEDLMRIHIRNLCDSFGLPARQTEEAVIMSAERFEKTRKDVLLDTYGAATGILPPGTKVDHHRDLVIRDLEALQGLRTDELGGTQV